MPFEDKTGAFATQIRRRGDGLISGADCLSLYTLRNSAAAEKLASNDPTDGKSLIWRKLPPDLPL